MLLLNYKQYIFSTKQFKWYLKAPKHKANESPKPGEVIYFTLKL